MDYKLDYGRRNIIQIVDAGVNNQGAAGRTERGCKVVMNTINLTIKEGII